MRLIPARAGNTQCRAPPFASAAAHPRSRGEHRITARFMNKDFGSSPLARGTQPLSVVVCDPPRLIPARAGNTWGRRGVPGWGSAHPRSRGEHGSGSITVKDVTGSSPLARGTPVGLATDTLARRLIPARAGNTAAPGSAEPQTSAHPRSRGEHTWWLGVAIVAIGSSPLARGTR